MPVNLGNPGEMTLLELAECVIEVTGARSEIVFEALPQDDPKVRQPDISLAREVLDWEPEIELRDGLRNTIDRSGVERLIGTWLNALSAISIASSSGASRHAGEIAGDRRRDPLRGVRGDRRQAQDLVHLLTVRRRHADLVRECPHPFLRCHFERLLSASQEA